MKIEKRGGPTHIREKTRAIVERLLPDKRDGRCQEGWYGANCFLSTAHRICTFDSSRRPSELEMMKFLRVVLPLYAAYSLLQASRAAVVPTIYILQIQGSSSTLNYPYTPASSCIYSPTLPCSSEERGYPS